MLEDFVSQIARLVVRRQTLLHFRKIFTRPNRLDVRDDIAVWVTHLHGFQSLSQKFGLLVVQNNFRHVRLLTIHSLSDGHGPSKALFNHSLPDAITSNSSSTPFASSGRPAIGQRCVG